MFLICKHNKSLHQHIGESSKSGQRNLWSEEQVSIPSQKCGDKAISVIELVVVITISIVVLAGLLDLTSFSLGISTIIKHTNQAQALGQEIMEAVRNFKETTDWNTDGLGTLSTSTDYFISATGTPLTWQLFSGKEKIDIFERKVVFEEVRRDVNDDIVLSGGTVDPNTKKVTAVVFWPEKGRTRQIKLITYLTNWAPQ